MYIENVSMIWYCIVNITSLDWPAYAKDQKPGVYLIACPVTFLSVAEYQLTNGPDTFISQA